MLREICFMLIGGAIALLVTRVLDIIEIRTEKYEFNRGYLEKQFEDRSVISMCDMCDAETKRALLNLIDKN